MTPVPSTQKKYSCPNCDDMQQFANKIGDESYRVDAARQYLAFALIHLIREIKEGAARGETVIEIPRILSRLDGTQQGTRFKMNGVMPHTRRGDQPVLPKGDPPSRSQETIHLILRIVAGKCEELARIEPDGSHSKRALSDLSLLAEGWITPESLGYNTPS